MMVLKSSPVPKAQQPVNEYNSLKYSVDFGWTHTTTPVFLRSMFVIFLGIYFIWSFILYSNSRDQIFTIDNIIFVSILTNSSVLLLLLRYYIGWNYIYSRLIQATVSYEESGWYDGQTWIKPPDSLLQDRLVATYEVLPILSRIKQVIIASILLILLGLLVFEFIIR